MPFDRLTVMDFEDLRDRIPETLAAGARYVRHRITPDNLASTLDEHLGTGDMLINLSWNTGAEDIISWCHDHGVLYVDTSVEQWDPYAHMNTSHPAERTLYARHLSLPDDLDHREVLSVAGPYLGPSPSIPTDWTPAQTGPGLFDQFLGIRRPPMCGSSATSWCLSGSMKNNTLCRLQLTLAANRMG